MKKMYCFLMILLGMIIPNLISFSQIPTDGLIAYYPFESITQNGLGQPIIADATGNGKDFKLANNPQITTGLKGNGLQLTGRCNIASNCSGYTGDHIYDWFTTQHFPFWNWPEFTISIWVKEYELLNSAGEAYIFWGNTSYGWLGIMHDANGISFAVGAIDFDDNYKPITIPFSQSDRNVFIHYSLTYKNGTLYAYKNGELKGQKSQTVRMNGDGGDQGAIGRHFWGNIAYINQNTSTRFSGILDEVRVYNRALTSQDIDALYDSERIKLCPIQLMPSNQITNIGNIQQGETKNDNSTEHCSYFVVSGENNELFTSSYELNQEADYSGNDAIGHVTLKNFKFQVKSGTNWIDWDGKSELSLNTDDNSSQCNGRKEIRFFINEITASADAKPGTWNFRLSLTINSSGVKLTSANTFVIEVQPPPEEVKIGTQIWMKRNLDVAYYRNGDPIPQVTDPNEWANLTTGAWCYYNNDPANGAIYGKLYNWYAVNDPRGLAPEGWHVASDGEWTALTTFLGGESVAGGKLKETGFSHWLSPNTGATNESGFTALAGGWRMNSGGFYDSFNGDWWTSTELNSQNAIDRDLYSNSAAIGGFGDQKNYGFSVRCVKDGNIDENYSIAYLDQDQNNIYQVFLANETMTNKIQLTFEPTGVSFFDINDDATKIILSLFVGTKWDIYTANFSGTTISQKVDITSEVTNHQMAGGIWSPNNQKIAFGMNEFIGGGYWSLWLMDADGTNKHQVNAGRSGASNWSNDGIYLYGISWANYENGPNGMYEFNVTKYNTNLNTSEKITNYTLPRHTGSYIDLSVDNKNIYYTLFDNNIWYVIKKNLITNTETTITQMTIPGDTRWGPGLSINDVESKLLITNNDGIFVYNMNTSSMVKLSSVGSAPRWIRGQNGGNTLIVKSQAPIDDSKTYPNGIELTGEVVSDGGSEIIERGYCYSQSENPTINDSKSPAGKGIGTFPCLIGELKSNTMYYAKAYAINANGSGYGEQITFTTKESSEKVKYPYPIIFVHGINSSDLCFKETMKYLKGTCNFGNINVFDVILNSNNNQGPSKFEDDVMWDYFSVKDWLGIEHQIYPGKRNFDENRENLISGWYTGVNLFAINFDEHRIKGAYDVDWTGNDICDLSNQSAIVKQGYGLSKMINEVLYFTKSDKVILVGHSMGGLAIREYLQRSEDNNITKKWYPDKIHHVAKVVTIGTPHRGFDRPIPEILNLWPGIDDQSEAIRDMYPLDNIWGYHGIYLEGGKESEIITSSCYNRDVNCNSQVDNQLYKGINTLTFDNPNMVLPQDIYYTWIKSNGDGIVGFDRQWIYEINPINNLKSSSPLFGSETITTSGFHTSEGANYEDIIRGLDEPDFPKFAYRITLNEQYTGFSALRPSNEEDPDNSGNKSFVQSIDYDWYKFELKEPCLLIEFENNSKLNGRIDLYTLNDLPSNNENSNIFVEFPSNSGKISFSPQMSLETGTWYLRIKHENINSDSWEKPFKFTIRESSVPDGWEFFVDGISGNNNNDGTTPSSPTQTALPVLTHTYKKIVNISNTISSFVVNTGDFFKGLFNAMINSSSPCIISYSNDQVTFVNITFNDLDGTNPFFQIDGSGNIVCYDCKFISNGVELTDCAQIMAKVTGSGSGELFLNNLDCLPYNENVSLWLDPTNTNEMNDFPIDFWQDASIHYNNSSIDQNQRFPTYKHEALNNFPGVLFSRGAGAGGHGWGFDDVMEIKYSPEITSAEPDIMAVAESTYVSDSKNLLIVFKTPDADLMTGRQVLFEAGETTAGYNIYLDNGDIVFGMWNRLERMFLKYKPLPTFTLQPNTIYLAHLEYNGEAGQKQFRALLNGDASGMLPFSGLTKDPDDADGQPSVGLCGEVKGTRFHDYNIRTDNYAYTCNGLFGDVLLYNKSFTPDEMNEVYTYLNIRYGQGWTYPAGQPSKSPGEWIAITETEAIGKEASISAAVPNPFSDRTQFSLTLPEKQIIRIELFDALGSLVGTVFSGELGSGTRDITIDGTMLVPGLYTVRVSGSNMLLACKVIVMK